jgi:dephospho-CoA kinase
VTSEHAHWILIGGLASGKSQVRRFLEEAGIDTIDADSVGHLVLEPNGPAFDEVYSMWPQVVVDGRIDRAALAAIVFADQEQLALLESITHPHIFREISRRVATLDGPVVVEMPLIANPFGSGWRRIVVDCIDENRFRRAVERGMDEAEVRRRMDVQPKRAEWLAVADVVVPNNGDLAEAATTTMILGQIIMEDSRAGR